MKIYLLNHSWATECGLKRGFATWEDATEFFRRRRRNWHARSGRLDPARARLRAYRCTHCGMWHLGHGPRTA